MRALIAKHLRRLAHKVDPGYSGRRGLELGLQYGSERAKSAAQRLCESVMSQPAQTINVNHAIDIGGKIEEVVTKITLDMFGKVVDATSQLPKNDDDDDPADEA